MGLIVGGVVHMTTSKSIISTSCTVSLAFVLFLLETSLCSKAITLMDQEITAWEDVIEGTVKDHINIKATFLAVQGTELGQACLLSQGRNQEKSHLHRSVCLIPHLIEHPKYEYNNDNNCMHQSSNMIMVPC